MKTRILISIISLVIVTSSFKSPLPVNKTQIAGTTQFEGLFGEDDCAPGVVYFLTRNGVELDYQSPYVFHFCPDYSLTAVGKGGSISGSWHKDEIGNVSIEIAGPHEIFSLVSGTWQIIEHSENALELETFQGEHRTVRFERIQR